MRRSAGGQYNFIMTKPTKRFPFLMWGDLVEGRRPVLRRALAGFRAHECMYAWVYLTEYLAHRRLLESFAGLPSETRRNLLQAMDSTLWTKLERATVDPHFQLSGPMFESVATMTCLAAESGEPRPIFVELGSTFLTSKTRFEIIDRVARELDPEWPSLQPQWLGIDNSRFMHDTTRALHGESGIELVSDYGEVARPGRFAVFLSRFVASYAFRGGREFADYLGERFPAALVEDAHSTTLEELPVFNHGQRETFFSVPEVFARLEQHGMQVYLLDAYPDHPAGAARCHVLRYLALRKGLATKRFRQRLTALGFGDPGDPVTASALLQKLNDAVAPAQWRAVKRAKEESPVWGRTPFAGSSPAWNAFVRRAKDQVKRLVLYPAWRRYRFGGPLAEREILRALHDEKP